MGLRKLINQWWTKQVSAGIPFQNALRDQLGLKLKSSRAPIRRIVIDHVENPAEN
jgi:uncharacterized protein (TIGR03435 family)